MSILRTLRDRLASAPADGVLGIEKNVGATAATANLREPQAAQDAQAEATGDAGVAASKAGLRLQPFFISQWLLNDVLFIAMLLLALVGEILRLPVVYWVILTPVFGLISIAEGWSHFTSPRERVALACSIFAIWSALLVCIYILYSSSVQGVLNANASSLAMMTLIALGTFVAGVQARVWQICGVGALLFLAVPGVGWLDQSPLLLAAAAAVIVMLGGLVWWIKQMQIDAGPSRGADASAALHSANSNS